MTRPAIGGRQAVDADIRGFFRAANRHFYKVAINYGFRRPKFSPAFIKAEVNFLAFEDAEEDGAEKHAAISNWRSKAENSLELQERLELCKRIILSGGNGKGKADWLLFQGYLSGLNLNEIVFLTLGKVGPKEVKKRLKGIICRIREAVGVNPGLPMPPMPKEGKVEKGGER